MMFSDAYAIMQQRRQPMYYNVLQLAQAKHRAVSSALRHACKNRRCLRVDAALLEALPVHTHLYDL